jgi:hypothetical protein
MGACGADGAPTGDPGAAGEGAAGKADTFGLWEQLDQPDSFRGIEGTYSGSAPADDLGQEVTITTLTLEPGRPDLIGFPSGRYHAIIDQQDQVGVWNVGEKNRFQNAHLSLRPDGRAYGGPVIVIYLARRGLGSGEIDAIWTAREIDSTLDRNPIIPASILRRN